MIEVEIYHADGYFVSTFTMLPETTGRRAKIKTGWKGTLDLFDRHPKEGFLITYNGVKYEREDNEELIKKLFDE